MTEKEPERKRVTPQNLLVAALIVVTIQLVALLITYQDLPELVQIVQQGGSSFAPIGTTPSDSILNALVLVLFAFGATLVLLWVLRRRMVTSFKVLIFGSVSLSAFFLTLITVDSVTYGRVSADWELGIDVAVSLAVVALIGYTIFVKNQPVVSTAILAFIGAEVGAFFATTLNLWTALALPVAFSIYDIYAVFRGPLKQLIGTNQGVALNGMSIKLGEFTLGLGDVVFYTMLPALAYFHTVEPPLLNFTAPIAVILAIDVGVMITLVLLTRRRLLPGLPIPMMLGVLVLVAYLL